jgi:competence protein ComGC
MNMKSNCNKGTTLIEMIIAFAISSVIFLILGFVMERSIGSCNKGFKRMNMMQNADTAVFIIEKALREGMDSDITAAGRTITISNGSGLVSNIWQENDLIRACLNGGATIYILENVKSLNFSIAPTTAPAIQYGIVMENNDQVYKATATIRHRSRF